ncbi:MAG: hypothetical protein FJ030_17375 [Chloroflexi bacterium]|nr:hypothetical protein [Chloroflexota bacterium]
MTLSRRFTGDLRADALVALVVATALVGAFIFKQSLSAQTTPVADPNSGFALSLPSHWTINDDLPLDTFISAYNSRADSVYKSAIIGQSFLLDPDNPIDLDTIVDRLVERHGEELLGYHLLDIQSLAVAGAEARRIDYAFVAQPIDDPFMASPPVVVLAADVVIYTPAEYWVLTLSADEKIAAKEQNDFERIVESVSLPGR